MDLGQVAKSVFSTVYGWIGSFAAAAAMFWGLFKAIGALKNWIIKRKWWIRHVARRDAPQQILTITRDMTTRIEKMEEQVTSVSNDVGMLKTRLQVNNECTATVMLQKLMDAYHHYYLQGNPIPIDVRTALDCMFDQYKASNPTHNHVPQDFKERIGSCPIVGQATAM